MNVKKVQEFIKDSAWSLTICKDRALEEWEHKDYALLMQIESVNKFCQNMEGMEGEVIRKYIFMDILGKTRCYNDLSEEKKETLFNRLQKANLDKSIINAKEKYAELNAKAVEAQTRGESSLTVELLGMKAYFEQHNIRNARLEWLERHMDDADERKDA